MNFDRVTDEISKYLVGSRLAKLFLSFFLFQLCPDLNRTSSKLISCHIICWTKVATNFDKTGSWVQKLFHQTSIFDICVVIDKLPAGILYCLFDLYGFRFFAQKSPFFLIYHFFFNLVNSFCKRAVQNPNTSDVRKHQSQI